MLFWLMLGCLLPIIKLCRNNIPLIEFAICKDGQGYSIHVFQLLKNIDKKDLKKKKKIHC